MVEANDQTETRCMSTHAADGDAVRQGLEDDRVEYV